MSCRSTCGAQVWRQVGTSTCRVEDMCIHALHGRRKKLKSTIMMEVSHERQRVLVTFEELLRGVNVNSEFVGTKVNTRKQTWYQDIQACVRFEKSIIVSRPLIILCTVRPVHSPPQSLLPRARSLFLILYKGRRRRRSKRTTKASSRERTLLSSPHGGGFHLGKKK